MKVRIRRNGNGVSIKFSVEEVQRLFALSVADSSVPATDRFSSELFCALLAHGVTLPHDHATD